MNAHPVNRYNLLDRQVRAMAISSCITRPWIVIRLAAAQYTYIQYISETIDAHLSWPRDMQLIRARECRTTCVRVSVCVSELVRHTELAKAPQARERYARALADHWYTKPISRTQNSIDRWTHIYTHPFNIDESRAPRRIEMYVLYHWAISNRVPDPVCCEKTRSRDPLLYVVKLYR